jgi:hypothetical protein
LRVDVMEALEKEEPWGLAAVSVRELGPDSGT